ncbi:MAG: MFS transporter [Vicinamibacterales bacterium]
MSSQPAMVAADEIREQALLRIVRWRLLPFMFVLYIVSYVDRVNVGFASLQMNRDLGLSASVYGLGAGIFFLGYFVFEVPSNLLLERFGARPWIARIMVTWGVISAAMMFTTGVTSFFVLRLLLGVAEAGFFPGMILYLTYWFPERERAKTVALFMTANALAGVIGGPLSGALLTLDGATGLAGWQWLFLLEGIPAVVLGGVVLVYLPNGPREATWLPREDREWLAARREAERAGAVHTSVWEVLTNGPVWRFSLLYFSLVVALYSVSFWLPQILKRVSGQSDLVVGLLSSLPYVVAAIGMVVIGRHSDATGERRWHVAVPALVGATGLILSAVASSPALAIAAVALAALGIWGALGPFWALPTAWLRGSAAAAGIAWINSVGNLGGFVGPYGVGYLRDVTGNFAVALTALAGMLVVAAILAVKAPQAQAS